MTDIRTSNVVFILCIVPSREVLKKTDWEIGAVLHVYYQFLKDTPARREDYTEITKSDCFLLKLCTTIDELKTLICWKSIGLYFISKFQGSHTSWKTLKTWKSMAVLECSGKVLEKHNFSDCPGTVEFWLKCPGKVLEFIWSMEFGFL